MRVRLRPDLAVIAASVAEGSRILDIGCGDGALMAAVIAEPANALRVERGSVAREENRGDGRSSKASNDRSAFADRKSCCMRHRATLALDCIPVNRTPSPRRASSSSDPLAAHR